MLSAVRESVCTELSCNCVGNFELLEEVNCGDLLVTGRAAITMLVDDILSELEREIVSWEFAVGLQSHCHRLRQFEVISSWN